jgi:hypothetical protein
MGVSCSQVKNLDDLFVEFICWVFRFPSTTGTDALLVTFARMCAKCDALFLATVQLARASTTKNKIWASLAEELVQGHKHSGWFDIVKSKIGKRGLAREVFDQGATFAAERKSYCTVFAQYCFHHHCSVPAGNSSDLLRR